jgi:integrase
MAFLNRISERAKQQTKNIRYSRLSSFFNCIRTNIAHDFPNPCDNPIYRLILELTARGGMRVGEVLKLTPRDVHDRKLTLRDPKSGKEREPCEPLNNSEVPRKGPRHKSLNREEHEPDLKPITWSNDCVNPSCQTYSNLFHITESWKGAGPWRNLA